LVVGLSTGAWVRVLQSFPGVESIDVVEINPGYIDIIKEYSEVSPLLSDPRIHIHIDDGRRWLKRHPELLYDLVVQNTSLSWRAYATNVLSREYFSEVRSHMNPGAVLATNTTWSYDVYATAQDVFPYAYSYSNFVYASDHPLHLNKALVSEGLSFMTEAIKSSNSLLGQNKDSVIAKLTTGDFLPVKSLLSVGAGTTAGVITDQNMLNEYRHGRRLGPGILKALLPPEMPEVPHPEVINQQP
jgi:spermidine synthase